MTNDEEADKIIEKLKNAGDPWWITAGTLEMDLYIIPTVTIDYISLAFKIHGKEIIIDEGSGSGSNN